MMVKTNSIKAWFLAARPVTLSAAAVPVMLGVALAYKDSSANCQWVPALLCLLFAWIMQIDSNFVNDFFDFKHGNDDETRLGPKRACAEGWITMKAMKWGILFTTLLGCIIGLPLAFYGGKEMIIVGICCVLFCFLYTTKLSYLGLGDLLVLLFFGIVPVCCTYYLVMPEGMQGVSTEAILTSIACGLVVDTLLILNNYRDYDNDIKAGKKTLIVHIGKKNGERLYCALGNIGVLIMIGINIYGALAYDADSKFLPFAAVCLVQHNRTFAKMRKIREGRMLNKVLGYTALNIFAFGIISTFIIIGMMN